MTNLKLFILNLPNPSNRKVTRDYAGGFGTAVPLSRIRRKQSGAPYLNLFLPYSAAVAQESSCEYTVLDAQALELSAAEVLRGVKKFDPDIVFSMISLPSIYEDKKILHAIKEELPNTTIVGCGAVCNVMPAEVFSESSIDLVARDFFPYVNSLACLLQNFGNSVGFEKLPGFSYVKGLELRNNPSEPPRKEFVDYTPLYDMLPLNRYEYITIEEGQRFLQIPVLGSSGCHYPCAYCPYPIGFGRRVVFQNPKSIVNEIENLNQLGVKFFDFRNQSFTFSRRWAEDVCRTILERKLDVLWACEARVNETSREILAQMRNSGCKRINFGVETGDPTLIKTAKPGVSIENTQDSFSVAKQLGIWRHAHIILGLPGENRKTLEKTSTFLTTLDPDSVSLNFAVPYPGTELYDFARKHNCIVTRNWKYYNSFDVVMVPPGLCPEDLYKTAKQIEKNLLVQKVKCAFSSEITLDSLMFALNSLLQISLAEIRFRIHVHTFHKKIVGSVNLQYR